MFAALTSLDAWQAAAIIAKAVLYGGSIAGAGGALFLLIFRAQLQPVESRRIARLVLCLTAIGILASIFRIILTAGTLGGAVASMTDWTMIRLVLNTGEAWSAGVRIFGLVISGLVVLKAPWIQYMAGLGPLLVSVSFALVGHSSAIGLQSAPQFLLAIHIFGLTYWVGALGPLRIFAGTADIFRTGMIMKRFGDIAVYGVGGLVLAALVVLWLLVETPQALIGSEYGRLVVVKLGLAGLLFGLAALNKLKLTPRLLRGERAGLRHIRRSIMGELLTVILIMLVTATFTTITGAPAVG